MKIRDLIDELASFDNQDADILIWDETYYGPLSEDDFWFKNGSLVFDTAPYNHMDSLFEDDDDED